MLNKRMVVLFLLPLTIIIAIVSNSPRLLSTNNVFGVSIPGGVAEDWTLISGHAFKCERYLPHYVLAQCETQLAGETLNVKVATSSFKNEVNRDCWATYAGKPIECVATVYSYVLGVPLPHVRITQQLNLSSADLRALFMQNWIANLPQNLWPWIAVILAIWFTWNVALCLRPALETWNQRERRVLLSIYSLIIFGMSFFGFIFGAINLWYID